MNRTELIELIDQGWNEFNSVLDSLSDEQKTEPILPDGWSVKDVVIHIAAWERELGKWLIFANVGEKPPVPRLTDEFVNAFNAQVYADNNMYPYDHLYRILHSIHNYFLMRQIEILPMEEDDPRWKVWRGGKPPWDLIAGNTYEHYQEHAEIIRQCFAERL